MEFPLLRQWITQIVNEYLKFGNCNFAFAISHVLFTSNVVLRLLIEYIREIKSDGWGKRQTSEFKLTSLTKTVQDNFYGQN